MSASLNASASWTTCRSSVSIPTYERPGGLVHVDVKKLGRIPEGGGRRTLGQQKGKKNKTGVGYSFIHSAIDDNSRLAYSEILGDERQETAAGFWKRANSFFASQGIPILRVLTDNGTCYRSRMFNEALCEAVKHKFTRPSRPQTNGEIERFHRTLASEWAYASHFASDAARDATYEAWIHGYNHHRPHTALGGLSPIDRVHNVNGKNTWAGWIIAPPSSAGFALQGGRHRRSARSRRVGCRGEPKTHWGRRRSLHTQSHGFPAPSRPPSAFFAACKARPHVS